MPRSRLAVGIALSVVTITVLTGYALWPAVTPRGSVTVWLVGSLLLGTAILATVLIMRSIRVGVEHQMLGTYLEWVMPGESLVLVECPPDRTRIVSELLRQEHYGQPSVFTQRAHYARTPPVSLEIRQERLTKHHLGRHAADQAMMHRINIRPVRVDAMRERIRAADHTIDTISSNLSDAMHHEQSISLAAEWLLDNAYLIRSHVAEVQGSLSQVRHDTLPALENSLHAGDPRIYFLASEFVALTDAEVSEPEIVHFLDAYQEHSPLQMSEIWALPLMLRVALLEAVAATATRMDQRQQEHERADLWSSRLLSAARHDPDHLIFALTQLAREEPDPSPYAVDRLTSQLQGEPLAFDATRSWLEHKMGVPIREVIDAAQRHLAFDQVTLSNAISSLRLLAYLDWRTVFERVCLVEHVLRDDPASVYDGMDFATRDRYRKVVEDLALGANVEEMAAARAAVDAARKASPQAPERHIGHFLIDVGRLDLEASLRYSPSRRLRLRRWIRRHHVALFFGGFGGLTLGVVGGVVVLVGLPDPAVTEILPFLLLLMSALFLGSEVTMRLIDTVMARMVPPEALPKMDYRDGIPANCRTLVVVPEVWASPDEARRSLERLEVRLLANRDPNLQFALLADLADAHQQTMPIDEAIVTAALAGTEDLNCRHEGYPFVLFMRGRRWSESEQVWMGWERKRGKLDELNRLIVGDPDQRTENHEGDLKVVGGRIQLDSFRFVITLDADTLLPRDAAQRMVATLAHPLNRPRLAPDGMTVEGGYGILQPRMSTGLPSVTASRFSRLFADSIGVDPYTHLVSHMYQDLTGEGIYYGKGIYDPHILHRILDRRFPDASILSHDLLEGAYARVGYAPDIELFEHSPERYVAFAGRQHRWIRGDWQIAAWCTPLVPSANGWVKNPLQAMNRWKILDNLRRSVVPIAAVTLLMGGCIWLPHHALVWSGFVASVVLFPALLHVVAIIARQPEVVIRFWRFPRVWREAANPWMRAALSLALLPHQALLAADAITRVGFRRLVSGRQLLEWQPSEIVQRTAARVRRDGTWRLTAVSGISAGLLIAIVLLNPTSAGPLLPFFILWIASPAIVSWLASAPLQTRERDLSTDDKRRLRLLARQTWRYFDDFVGPQSSWLPPDNYQEVLRLEVAQRTSPTNIGLWLLSALTAYDCGYLTMDDLVARLQETIATLNKLERYRGHVLNWYDVETLAPLNPRYVSTVDSGNLLSNLWVVSQGLGRMLDQPLIGISILRGIADTTALLEESLRREIAPAAAAGHIDTLLATTISLCQNPPNHPAKLVHRLRALTRATRALAEAIRSMEEERPLSFRQLELPLVIAPSAEQAERQAVYWARQLAHEVDRWLVFVDRYVPSVGSPVPGEGGATGMPGADQTFWQDRPLEAIPSLRAMASEQWPPLRDLPDADGQADERASLSRSHAEAKALLARVEGLIGQCNVLADGMDMRFLYDPERSLFVTGYNVDTRLLDPSHYDLLASEARIASFVAIARGDVPEAHWLALGRTFSVVMGRRVLLSWSGTMFEYLMPQMIMRSFSHSLLDDACHGAVMAQIDYSLQHRIPWGISESAFSALDRHHIYQYQAFGVPGLGVRRGLEEDLVVAPYASALALTMEPASALRNFRRMCQLGLVGHYGFYDAIDFTPRRQSEGQNGIIAYTYMAHHQGMILITIGNVLHDNVMQDRFHADPRVRAAEPVLWEHIPTAPLTIHRPTPQHEPTHRLSDSLVAIPSRVTTPDTPIPRTQVLGSSTYSVMVTAAGGGYSRWRGIDITRWRADTTLDAWGSFCFVTDLEQGDSWSTAYQPTRHAGTSYAVTLFADRVRFERLDGEIGTVTEIAVSVEDAVELRRVTLTNYSDRPRLLEVTSYSELSLTLHGADLSHPAFSKLFVQTASWPDRHALLAWRNPRSRDEHPIWATHLLALPDGVATSDSAVEFETDRNRFVGRGHSMEQPAALSRPLSGTSGWVLDPIFSLRCRVSLAPDQQVQLVLVTGAAETRDEIMTLVEKYHDIHIAHRAFDLTRALMDLEPRKLHFSSTHIQQFQKLASHMLYPNLRMRAAGKLVRENRRDQTGLWSHGISGDLPIMLITIGSIRDLPSVRESLAAHSFWRVRGFVTDLVILNQEPSGYEKPLEWELRTMMQWHEQYTPPDQPGGIFLRSVDQISADDLLLLQAAARVVLVASRGPLARQMAAMDKPLVRPRPLTWRRDPVQEPSASLPFLELPYFNGLGGFTPDGKEYAIYLPPGSHTPAPWVNVMSNATFGALISETGAGFCWSQNSQTNRLLPWSNDPVRDPASDAIYIRDDDTGEVWSPTAAPIREQDAYRTRHGQGYTVFEHTSHAIEQELVTFVPVDGSGGAPVRLQRLRLNNHSTRRRRISVIGYAEWVLGRDREDTQTHIVSQWDIESQSIFARNYYHPDAGARIAFASSSPLPTSYTADRSEFLGRNGSIAEPAALRRESLSGTVDARLDPCAVLHVEMEMEPGQGLEVTFCLGQTAEPSEARALVRRFRDAHNVQEAFDATRAWWDDLLGTIQVETPDLAINFMLNRWLPYQTLSCRTWGRSGFYQSGGAFGFRDQLQDAMALVYAAPDLSRSQILAAASRQFIEGDVQHWWHPGTGAGVRTHISDDLLWLPYVTTHYVRVTGDVGILDEILPFLDAPTLSEQEHERYFVPTPATEHGTLIEHCHRAIARGHTAGPHGLPLIGTGDWNDGMNLVGADGQGESVWLAWFLIDVLEGFAELIEPRGEASLAARYAAAAERLAAAVEATAWDGAWYRRAFFDDGTPLGSKDSPEARIDSLPQSWGVLSGAADPDRARQALRSVENELIREHDRLILLFSPPFEHSTLDPGYVGQYPPGVRENGGQYTHAAIWVAMAFARLGDGDRAVSLLRMLNPVEHARTEEDVKRYMIEPYVVAADVYALEGHIGQGGWSWYTGSSGWMYRVWIEEILGFRLRADRLTINPVIPHDWQGFSLAFRFGTARYAVSVANPNAAGCGVLWMEVDGVRAAGSTIVLNDDGVNHEVTVMLGDVGGKVPT